MKQYELPALAMNPHGLMKGTYEPSIVAGLHRHGEIELNILERGSIVYMYGGTKKVVKQGETAVFWAAIPHQIIQSDETTMLHWLTIPFDIFLQWQLPSSLARRIVCGIFITVATDKQHNTIALLKQWEADLTDKNDDYQKIVYLEVEALLRRFALKTLSVKDIEEKLSSDQSPRSTEIEIASYYQVSQIELMARCIAERYTEPLHVQQIADVVHLHPHYAMKLFRQYFALSITEYITQYRLAHAKRLLITSNEGILEIALASGFGSLSHFYTIFKNSCGHSPGSYRTTYSLKQDYMQ